MTKADLRQAYLGPLPLTAERSTPSTLAGANLRYTQFQTADLSFAVMDGADLRGADFTAARMAKASVRGCNIDKAVGLDLNQ